MINRKRKIDLYNFECLSQSITKTYTAVGITMKHALCILDELISKIEDPYDQKNDNSSSCATLQIGTWNVHGFRNMKTNNSNVQSICRILQSKDVNIDILCLQDSKDMIDDKSNNFSKLANALNAKKLSLKNMSPDINNVSTTINDCCLFSKTSYKIIDTITTDNNKIITLVSLPNDLFKYSNVKPRIECMGIINIHDYCCFDNNENRLNQFQYQIKTVIQRKYFQNIPLILLGDLSALCKSDYTRKRSSEIIEFIKNKFTCKFYDCFQLFNKDSLELVDFDTQLIMVVSIVLIIFLSMMFF